MHTTTALGSAPQACHVGLGAGLVEEHQVGGIRLRLQATPPLTRSRYVGSALFAGTEGLFSICQPHLCQHVMDGLDRAIDIDGIT